jgi:hypothetical protein
MKTIVYNIDKNPPEIDRKELCRYAGIGGENAETTYLCDECVALASSAFSYKAVYARVGVSVDGDRVAIGELSAESKSLSKYFDGAFEAFLFCATVGVGIDRLIGRYSLISPSKAVILQALGSERVEALCDSLCADLALILSAEDKALKPRVSPGYGDIPIELHKEIAELLGAQRTLGVSFGEGLLASPSKTVTAIIAVKSLDRS